jgi:hypothetical protein
MWVFIRPQGGKECNLLTCEIREGLEDCPIHRFDGMNQILIDWAETSHGRASREVANVERNGLHANLVLLLGNIFRTKLRKRLSLGNKTRAFPYR